MGVTGVKPGVLLDERLTGTPTLCLLRKSGTRVLDRLRLLVKSTFQHTQSAEAAASFARKPAVAAQTLFSESAVPQMFTA